MALQVVGTGFGRTGTNSLKLALEQLGFGPCHHMFEVRDNPALLPYWQAAAHGALPDWDAVFAGYAASVDWPGARFWREITTHFSAAKVVHSTRDAESWIRSVHATIWPAMRDRASRAAGPARDRMEMAHALIVEQTFGGRLDDADHAVAVYRAHEAEVRRSIPAALLLVYEVAAGWGPLCAFLGVPVPESPFPRVNTTEQFHKRPMGSGSRRGG